MDSKYAKERGSTITFTYILKLLLDVNMYKYLSALITKPTAASSELQPYINLSFVVTAKVA